MQSNYFLKNFQVLGTVNDKEKYKVLPITIDFKDGNVIYCTMYASAAYVKIFQDTGFEPVTKKEFENDIDEEAFY